MTPADLAAVARRQNDEDAAKGHCTRYVEDPTVLTRVAAMILAAVPAGRGAKGGEKGGEDAAA
jgi:hypothetical protein